MNVPMIVLKPSMERTLTPDKISEFPDNFHLTQDYVAVKMDAPKTAIGSFVLPEVSVERPFTGTVVAVGDDVKRLCVGVKVWFGKFAGAMYDLDEPEISQKELLILHEEDIILWRD